MTGLVLYEERIRTTANEDIRSAIGSNRFSVWSKLGYSVATEHRIITKKMLVWKKKSCIALHSKPEYPVSRNRTLPKLLAAFISGIESNHDEECTPPTNKPIRANEATRVVEIWKKKNVTHEHNAFIDNYSSLPRDVSPRRCVLFHVVFHWM